MFPECLSRGDCYAFLMGALKLIGAESHDDLSPSTSLVPPPLPTPTCASHYLQNTLFKVVV
jgi:hypothetical protein